MKIRHKAMARAAYRAALDRWADSGEWSFHSTYGRIYTLGSFPEQIYRWHRNYRGMR